MAGVTTEAIVALDVPDGDSAKAVVEQLDGLCRFYKVGNELFTAAGPTIVRWLVDRGDDVFLDLKFHDIPNTVGAGVRNAAALGARLVTVHASGGRRMLDAAVAAAGDVCDVMAVTVLTSLDDAELGEAWGRESPAPSFEAARLARLAQSAGVVGVVCAGSEAAAIHREHGGSLALLVPGVRLEGDPAGDQRRVVTPREAAAAGASYVVLGRTVTAAASPAEAMARASGEIMRGCADRA